MMEEAIGRIVIIGLIWIVATFIGCNAPVVATAALLTTVVMLV